MKTVNLKIIENRLIGLGYYTALTPIHLMVIRDNGYVGTSNIEAQDLFCLVRDTEKGAQVVYNFANISDEVFFNSELEVIRFIKKQFPI